MNFAETAVKDHSAEQSPSPAGPQQDSHSLASGHCSRQFPWCRNGPQSSFVGQPWGEAELQWPSSNHSSVPHMPRIRVDMACPQPFRRPAHSHVPFMADNSIKPRSEAPASQQLGNCWHERQEENHHFNVEGTDGWLAQWEFSKAQTIPMHTTMSGSIPAPTLFKPDLQIAFITNSNSTQPLLKLCLDFWDLSFPWQRSLFPSQLSHVSQRQWRTNHSCSSPTRARAIFSSPCTSR